MNQERALFLSSSFPLGLFIGALFYQHWLDMQPCFMCIQQRSLLLLSGLLSLTSWLIAVYSDANEKRLYVFKSLLSLVLVAFSMTSAVLAKNIAHEHLDNANSQYGFLFSTCQSVSPIPSWLPPFDAWLPSVFSATGSCAGDIAKAFGIEMPYFVILGAVAHFMLSSFFIIMRTSRLYRYL